MQMVVADAPEDMQLAEVTPTQAEVTEQFGKSEQMAAQIAEQLGEGDKGESKGKGYGKDGGKGISGKDKGLPFGKDKQGFFDKLKAKGFDMDKLKGKGDAIFKGKKGFQFGDPSSSSSAGLDAWNQPSAPPQERQVL
jgi:hypothetical protein